MRPMSTIRPSITALVSITTSCGDDLDRTPGSRVFPDSARHQHVPLSAGCPQHDQGQDDGHRRRVLGSAPATPPRFDSGTPTSTPISRPMTMAITPSANSPAFAWLSRSTAQRVG